MSVPSLFHVYDLIIYVLNIYLFLLYCGLGKWLFNY